MSGGGERAADARGLGGNGAALVSVGTIASRLEPWVLPALLVLAALLRLPDLATRGAWDGDQGHDMLVLRSFVRDGVVPLLGPPTSIGDVHHGAWYYYLLSPIAALTGGDSPLAVVGVIVVAGIAAVGVVWWLARSIAGPVAGLVAGLALATSAAAIDESTFIWNPNLIALFSAIALAGAWRAWSGASPRWWLLAALGTAVTMQAHVLGVALLPIVGVPLVLDARRRSMGRVPLGIVGIFAAAYLPLAINELTTGFSELRAALDYLASARTSTAAAIPVRFGIVGLRVVSWPLVGLITAGFGAAVVATVAIIGIVALLWRRDGPGTGRGSGRAVARWYGLGLLWSVAFLTVAAPSLASVITGLPNDHYHAFADPMVVVLVGIGAAAIGGASRLGSSVAIAGLLALVGWNLTHLPPAVHPDGGYPAGQVAGDRVLAALGRAGVTSDDVVLLRSLPDFKSTESVAYPLVRAGQSLIAETPTGVAPGSVIGAAGGARAGEAVALVLLCDDLFIESNGAACGGPAEDGTADVQLWGPILDRFEAHPGRWVSVYGPRP
ncbi:MAG: glycosyltransferase family 39 protein [Candidatus Limnocylindrales bacterium]